MKKTKGEYLTEPSEADAVQQDFSGLSSAESGFRGKNPPAKERTSFTEKIIDAPKGAKGLGFPKPRPLPGADVTPD